MKAIENIDWDIFYMQKKELVSAIATLKIEAHAAGNAGEPDLKKQYNETIDGLTGILHMMDNIQNEHEGIMTHPIGSDEYKIANYLSHEWNKCPHCESYNISAFDPVIHDNKIIQNISCHDCYAKWDDIYTLTDIKLKKDENS